MQSLSTNINDLKFPVTRTEERAAARFLALLEKMEQKSTIQFAKQRKHARQTIRGTLIVSLQSEVEHVCDIRNEETSAALCWSISQAGASFLFPGSLGKHNILVGFTVQEDEYSWFDSEIVRKRKIPDVDFWEYGLKFLRKIDS
ncbi:hypothetical protein [uncultured Gimesia sp.]|uniref:hypothetical protein n=1 Tax=uncultured Gimesia sp. TaxID=1678688 RepID=UPI0030D8E054|tara:strand:+ start:6085 stop:6516 length:432 start_codon:yes stop_codon:yes gene_type:complete